MENERDEKGREKGKEIRRERDGEDEVFRASDLTLRNLCRCL